VSGQIGSEHPVRRPAVVTGASSGIGAATAVALAAAGHPVILAARRTDVCEEIAGVIREQGGEAIALSLDLADTDSVAAFTSRALDVYGSVEILVSNAGDVLPRTALGTDPESFARQVDVNLLGAHRLVHALVPPMVARRRGDIVFVTSDVVGNPRPSMSSYVTSKWGLEGLARSLQMELEGTGVRASIVRPGPTMTGLGMSWDAAVVVPLLDLWKRWGLVRHDGYLGPEAIAGAVMAAATAPRGTHLTLIDVQPEAPIQG
jgi:NAD(P)-dependent dehydrogenase (short-subunit alcohol dehydrogenase family)